MGAFIDECEASDLDSLMVCEDKSPPIFMGPSELVLVWGLITSVDYRKVLHNFDRPVFARPAITADDGSGLYKGLGYYLEIQFYARG